MKKIAIVFAILLWAGTLYAGSRPTVSGDTLADLGKCDDKGGATCVIAEATHPDPKFNNQLIQFISLKNTGKCDYAILFERQKNGKWKYIDTTTCKDARGIVLMTTKLYKVKFEDFYKEAKLK